MELVQAGLRFDQSRQVRCSNLFKDGLPLNIPNWDNSTAVTVSVSHARIGASCAIVRIGRPGFLVLLARTWSIKGKSKGPETNGGQTRLGQDLTVSYTLTNRLMNGWLERCN